MTPILSVAVPTHNRARYAIHAIRSLLDIRDEGLEVVVTDTSPEPELERLLREQGLLDDRRLRYVRPAERLDMTGNHNAAVGLATGEYVCLIGDDDTISPDALAAARWAAAHDMEVIAPNVVANYVWPDFRSRWFGARHSSRVYFAREMGAATVHRAEGALDQALRNAIQGTDGLPKIYHGLVRRSLLETIRERSGAYFHGSSPDVSGAVGLAVCARKFLVVDYPLTIPGASGGSNTGRSALNQHKGKLEAEEQTKGFREKGWSAGVPRFFSVETVWAHAALETLGRILPDAVPRYGFVRLISLCRIRHAEYGTEIDAAATEAAALQGVSRAEFDARVAADLRRVRLQELARVAKRMLRPTAAGGRAYVGGLETVAAAPEQVSAHLRKRGASWDGTVAGVATS
ncbi:glycosyltransferase family 2 protein [Ramlibacter sp. Leaf400]|uniref:glycosyltransferase family 2 protein n=1 Tax=Ramlibacter sp. Leaf400 TaxID=1736365 RepID=UPI0006FA47D5|nr:glycosyltransferase family 2 protein [Ramlibacter sp. Leaf400]KQT14362.1 hypothetical protein ASG30_01945 [Ramlibacter sp. Leaf400]